MPRDGSGNYTKAFPDVVTNTTIASAMFNGTVNDIATDLNTPRPIVAGGTGANNATQARLNMQAERSMQVVTNFDSQPWETGSFSAAVGATGSPDGTGASTNVYLGTVEVIDASNAVVEARNLTTGTMYMRKKVAGTWSGWTADSGSAVLGNYVLKTGDTMTGNLTISLANATLTLNKTVNGTVNAVMGQYNGANRWQLQVGNGVSETGGNAGSDFGIYRYNDAAALIDGPLVISRATGEAKFSAGLVSVGYIWNYGFGGDNTKSIWYMNQSGSRYLTWDGSNYVFQGANVYSSAGRLWGANDGTPFWATGGQITGDVSITKSQANLYLVSTSASPPQLQFYYNNTPQSFINDNGGSINVYSNAAGTSGMYIAHGANAWSAISDARLAYKRTARDITDNLPSLDSYRLYENEVNGRLDVFANAQNVAELFPHVVIKGDDDLDYVPTGMGDQRAWGMSYDRLSAVALAYIRQQEKVIADLKARIEALEAG